MSFFYDFGWVFYETDPDPQHCLEWYICMTVSCLWIFLRSKQVFVLMCQRTIFGLFLLCTACITLFLSSGLLWVAFSYLLTKTSAFLNYRQLFRYWVYSVVFRPILSDSGKIRYLAGYPVKNPDIRYPVNLEKALSASGPTLISCYIRQWWGLNINFTVA